jgi:hypothetical protein
MGSVIYHVNENLSDKQFFLAAAPSDRDESSDYAVSCFNPKCGNFTGYGRKGTERELEGYTVYSSKGKNKRDREDVYDTHNTYYVNPKRSGIKDLKYSVSNVSRYDAAENGIDVMVEVGASLIQDGDGLTPTKILPAQICKIVAADNPSVVYMDMTKNPKVDRMSEAPIIRPLKYIYSVVPVEESEEEFLAEFTDSNGNVQVPARIMCTDTRRSGSDAKVTRTENYLVVDSVNPTASVEYVEQKPWWPIDWSNSTDKSSPVLKNTTMEH